MTTDQEDNPKRITYHDARKASGEAYMMCNECGARLFSFDGPGDASRNCPYMKSGKCEPPQPK